MTRRLENIARLAALDYLTRIHHDDVVRGFRHQRQIVRNQDQRHILLLLQLQQQLDNLCLNGHVQRRGWLVGDQQLWPTGDRHGDHHALTHAARQLMRIDIQSRRRVGNADLRQQIDSALTASAAVAALMHLNRFHDLVADSVAGVQAGHRILENHRHFRAHQLAALFLGDAFQVALVELQLLRHHFAGKVDQAHNRQRTDRFA